MLEITCTSRHTHTESLWEPERDGCLRLRCSEHSWQVAVAWGSAKEHGHRTTSGGPKGHTFRVPCPPWGVPRHAHPGAVKSLPSLHPFVVHPTAGGGPGGHADVAPWALCGPQGGGTLAQGPPSRLPGVVGFALPALSLALYPALIPALRQRRHADNQDNETAAFASGKNPKVIPNKRWGRSPPSPHNGTPTLHAPLIGIGTDTDTDTDTQGTSQAPAGLGLLVCRPGRSVKTGLASNTPHQRGWVETHKHEHVWQDWACYCVALAGVSRLGLPRSPRDTGTDTDTETYTDTQMQAKAQAQTQTQTLRGRHRHPQA